MTVTAEDSSYAEDSPYLLVSVTADHPDPYRASEAVRTSVPPDNWLWCYVKPEKRDRFLVVVLMERRPDGAQPLLELLAGLGCGDLAGDEAALDEPVAPPRTPMRQRWRGR